MKVRDTMPLNTDGAVKEKKPYPGRVWVKNWAKEERPREKLLNKGGDSLSDAELLAIILGSGSPGKSSVDLGREVLKVAGGKFLKISKFSINKLQEIPGIGFAKATKLHALLEITRRYEYEAPKKQKIVTSYNAFQELRIELADLDHEEFWVLYLNRRSTLIAKRQISSGGISSTIVDPRIIFHNALDLKASSIILAHNHPSGNLTASQSDIALTNKLVEGGKIIDVQVVDHLILAGKNYCSFADSGLL